MSGIEDVIALLDEPGKWSRRDPARTADGRVVGWWHPEAVAFCLASAVYRADLDPAEEAALRRLVPGGMLGLWNDHETTDPKDPKRVVTRSHGEVVALLAKALERVRKDRRKKAGRTPE